jgi:hypothetical protein
MKYFRNQKKQICRFTMESRSKSFIFPHLVEEEQRGVMDIWCTSGLRRDPSITSGGLDASQSMRPTINEESDCLRKKNGGGGNTPASEYGGGGHMRSKLIFWEATYKF